MRVLAIDPGYDRMGVAVLDRGLNGKEDYVFSSCIETDKQSDIPDRLFQIGTELEDLINQYQPDCLGVETLFFNKNQKTAMAVAEARGIVLYLAKKSNCKLYEIGPQEIKVAVTGYGNSDKDAVRDMLKRLVPGLPEKALDDEYDAIAVGVTSLALYR